MAWTVTVQDVKMGTNKECSIDLRMEADGGANVINATYTFYLNFEVNVDSILSMVREKVTSLIYQPDPMVALNNLKGQVIFKV